MGIYEERNSTLDEAKKNCLIELEVWYGGRVLDTFDCDVLGTMHRYQCTESDQLRMINGKVSGIAMPLMCGLIISADDPAYDLLEHTAEQCGLVHTAYVNFSKAVSTQYANYRQRINTATALAELSTLFNEIVYGVK